jgi:pimeloyl-ACP methyl ester carboxylesterase
MTLLLKGNASMYNLFLDSNHQHQYGERGGGSLVVTPEGRDNAGTYSGYDAADVFEAWADAARHYPVDPGWSAISGYSLGGLGSTKLAQSYPDLFGAVASIVGTPNGPGLRSLRHVPIMQWDVTVDELNPYAPAALADMQQYGLRYESLLFPGDHFTPATFDEYGPAVDFLADKRAIRDPAHVTYLYFQDGADVSNRPQKDAPKLGLVADHAYWLSNLRVAAPGVGTVDAVSHGFGQGDPVPSGPQEGAGTTMGGNLPAPLPYSRTYQTWGEAPVRPAADHIDISLENISALTIDPARARVSCNADLRVTSDAPVTVKLAGCRGERRFPATG